MSQVPRGRDPFSRSLERETIQIALEAAFGQGKGIEKDAREAIQELDRQIALYAIAHLIQSVRDRYASLPQGVTYLEQVQADILEPIFIRKMNPVPVDARQRRER